MADQVDGPAHQAAGSWTAGTRGRWAWTALERPPRCAAAAADAVEGQEGEPAGPALLEQLDRPGGDAVVFDHHLAEAGAGRHLQGHPVALLHLGKLGHRPVDPLQS